MTWEEILTTKFGVWVYTRSSKDNIFYGSARTVEKNVILLQIQKATESSNSDLRCNLFRLEDTAAFLATTDSNEILSIKEYVSHSQLCNS